MSEMCAGATLEEEPPRRCRPPTEGMPKLNDMSTWALHTRSGLRQFLSKEAHWIEQNPVKNSRWAKLARQGHAIAWEFENREGGGYTGRVLIDGEIMSAKEAHERFIAR